MLPTLANIKLPGRHCHDPVYDGDDVHPAQLIRSTGYEARLALWAARRDAAVDPGVGGLD